MPCTKHQWTSPDSCAACRHNARMEQDRRLHNQQMDAINPPPPPAPSHLGRNMLIGVLAIPVLLILGLVVGIIMGLAALALVLIQGALAGLLVGVLVGSAVYLMHRRRPEAQAFAFTQPDPGLPVKDRMMETYRSLDATTAAAVKAGAIAGAVACCWVVLV